MLIIHSRGDGLACQDMGYTCGGHVPDGVYCNRSVFPARIRDTVSTKRHVQLKRYILDVRLSGMQSVSFTYAAGDRPCKLWAAATAFIRHSCFEADRLDKESIVMRAFPIDKCPRCTILILKSCWKSFA